MGTETINWNAIVGGTSAPLPSGDVDTGQVIATLTPNAGSAGSVTVNTTATDPDNSPSNPNDSQLSLTGTVASPTSLSVNFADDSGSPGIYGAYDATFGINDIDAGSAGGGYRDRIELKAFDTSGNPLQITVTPNSGYTVTQNGDGSVTILANYNTNSWNAPSAFAQVKVVGGPIGSISLDFINDGVAGSHNIMLTNITYTTNPICFLAGTMIETERGEVVVEDVVCGDMVRTRDNGFQTVRWAGSNKLSAQTLAAAPHLRPIRIAAGALGCGTPTRDLYVSPQHRILVRSRIAERMFDASEVLVTAKQLLIVDGVDYCDDGADVTYVHFLCDQHEVVFSNGAETETLFTGPEALKTVGSAARKEIFEIFPELAEADFEARSVRPLTSGRLGRKLVHRHAQNNRSLVGQIQ